MQRMARDCIGVGLGSCSGQPVNASGWQSLLFQINPLCAIIVQTKPHSQIVTMRAKSNTPKKVIEYKQLNAEFFTLNTKITTFPLSSVPSIETRAITFKNAGHYQLFKIFLAGIRINDGSMATEGYLKLQYRDDTHTVRVYSRRKGMEAILDKFFLELHMDWPEYHLKQGYVAYSHPEKKKFEENLFHQISFNAIAHISPEFLIQKQGYLQEIEKKRLEIIKLQDIKACLERQKWFLEQVISTDKQTPVYVDYEQESFSLMVLQYFSEQGEAAIAIQAITFKNKGMCNIFMDFLKLPFILGEGRNNRLDKILNPKNMSDHTVAFDPHPYTLAVLGKFFLEFDLVWPEVLQNHFQLDPLYKQHLIYDEIYYTRGLPCINLGGKPDQFAMLPTGFMQQFPNPPPTLAPLYKQYQQPAFSLMVAVATRYDDITPHEIKSVTFTDEKLFNIFVEYLKAIQLNMGKSAYQHLASDISNLTIKPDVIQNLIPYLGKFFLEFNFTWPEELYSLLALDRTYQQVILREANDYHRGTQTIYIGSTSRTISDQFKNTYLTPPPALVAPPIQQQVNAPVPQLPQNSVQPVAGEKDDWTADWVLVPENVLSSNSMFQNTPDEKGIISLAIKCIKTYQFSRKAESHDGMTRAASLLHLLTANQVTDVCKMLVLDAFLTINLTGRFSNIERSDLVKALRKVFSNPTTRSDIHKMALQYPVKSLQETQITIAQRLSEISTLHSLQQADISDASIVPFNQCKLLRK